MKKKAVLQICSALSALGAITGLSPHLTWVYVSRILMATSSTTSVLLNANGKVQALILDEHFWVTFAGTGMITLVATHLGIVVFSFSPLVPLWISLLASIFSFFSILRQTEDPGRSYKLKDYIPALKSLIKLSNASKIVSQALFESCFTILTILWNPMMFELSNDDTKVPSGLLVATFACCMLTGVLLFHNLKTKFQETRINLFSIISMMVLMFLMKSLCFHCIEIDGVAVFLMCLAWITSGVYFASKKPHGDLRDVISLITLSLLNGLIVYMTQNNFYNVILNASFLLSLGASLVAGPGFLKSSGSEGTTYVTI